MSWDTFKNIASEQLDKKGMTGFKKNLWDHKAHGATRAI